jgi:hypothetical protein
LGEAEDADTKPRAPTLSSRDRREWGRRPAQATYATAAEPHLCGKGKPAGVPAAERARLAEKPLSDATAALSVG